MPRSLSSAPRRAVLRVPLMATVGLVLWLGASPPGARAAMPTNAEVAAAAAAHGLVCEDVDDAGGGSTFLSCARQSGDPASDIDLSVTYNVVDPTTDSGFATVAAYLDPPPADWAALATDVATLFCDDPEDRVAAAIEAAAATAELDGCIIQVRDDGFASSVDIQPSFEAGPTEPSQWSADGRSTYDGTWTVAEYAFDGGGEGSHSLGDREPGQLVVDCLGPGDAFCGVIGTFGGESFLARSAERVADGALRRVETEELANCGDGQTLTRTIDVDFGPSDATASDAVVYDPRTCTEGNSTLYMTDLTWVFEGTLVDFEPRATGELESFLTSYGLTCEADGETTTACTLEIADGEGADATYRVVIERDADDEVVAVTAEAISVDASMPSDAFGFLRGIAERTPVADAEALVAWLDAAAGDPNAAAYAVEPWTATWSEDEGGGSVTWTLAVARADEAVGSAAPSEAAAPVATPQPNTGRPGAAGGGADRPFRDSIPTVDEISTDPVVLLQSAALAALLVFLMPFPAQLFNSTLETHEDEVRRWFRLDRLGVVAAGAGRFWSSWPGVLTFTLLATLLYGFLDPSFGLDADSAATFVGMLAGIVAVTAAFAVPAALAHRRIGDRPTVKVVPISLLVGVACVLLSRITGFQPGYLYGLLIGLVFAGELSAAEEGRATALGAGLMLAAALLAWLGLGALPDGDGFGPVVVRTVLAALMVAGLEGVVFGLLPMRFLPGEPLYAWNRLLWGGLLGVGAFAFFHVLINPASGYLSDTSRTPLLTVVALLVGFSLVSVAFWAWFRFRSDPLADRERAPG